MGAVTDSPSPELPNERELAPWLAAGFAADEVTAWQEALEDTYAAVAMPQRAKEWRAAGHGAEGTSWWLNIGIPARPVTPGWASFCDSHGWQPADVALMDLFLSRVDPDSPVADRRSWITSKLRPDEALELMYAGVSATEGEELLEGLVGSVFGLGDTLRQRAALQPGFEPDIAVLINDLVDYQHGPGDHGLIHLEHVRDARDIAAARAAQERAQQLFGCPNADGVYLVAVIEFSADANEDGWTYADMMADGAVSSAARELGWEKREAMITRGAGLGVLPNGIRLAAITHTVEGTRPWFRHSRAPNDEERGRWAGRTVG